MSAIRAVDGLLPYVYEDLRRLARVYLRRERRGEILGPTALVHEVYVRLAARRGVAWQGEGHVLAVAALEMRRVLVERARAAAARKRGGRPRRVALREGTLVAPERTLIAVAVAEALAQLAKRSPRQARVATLRLHEGLQTVEIAAVLGVSPRTVGADWRAARASLARVLRRPRSASGEPGQGRVLDGTLEDAS